MSRNEYYRHFFEMVMSSNVLSDPLSQEKSRADKIVKAELARMQKQMQSKTRPKTF